MIRRASSGTATADLVAPFLAAAREFQQASAELPGAAVEQSHALDAADRRRSQRRAREWSADGAGDTIRVDAKRQIGRASCRERV